MSSTAAALPIPSIATKRCECGALFNGWWIRCAECEYQIKSEHRMYSRDTR